MTTPINKATAKLLAALDAYQKNFKGAFHLWENGHCAGMRSSANIKIKEKTTKAGIDITIAADTKDETVYIPACISQGGLNDEVENDFYIGANACVKIVAGCGIHSESDTKTRHSGIHSFTVGENAHVIYEEKHIGTGKASAARIIDPITKIVLGKNSYFELQTTQISGVDYSKRITEAVVGENAKLIIRERLFTENNQKADSKFTITLKEKGASADLVSRSVAKDHSVQSYESTIIAENAGSGHSECDAIIADEAIVDASPRLFAHHKDAALIHEAAIGKIANEQILKLRTLGLTEEEAEAKIIEGFLA